MASTKLSTYEEKKSFFDRLHKQKIETSSQIATPNLSALDKILNQRQLQRWILFIFSLVLSALAFIFLVAIVTAQIIVTIAHGKSFQLFSGSELQILSVSVFGQIIGVIIIITKSLWDDKNYKTMIDKEHSSKHKNY